MAASGPAFELLFQNFQINDEKHKSSTKVKIITEVCKFVIETFCIIGLTFHLLCNCMTICKNYCLRGWHLNHISILFVFDRAEKYLHQNKQCLQYVQGNSKWNLLKGNWRKYTCCIAVIETPVQNAWFNLKCLSRNIAL